MVVLGSGLGAAFYLGLLKPDHLLGLGFSALFIAGGFGLIVGTLMFRFLKMGERSKNAFRFAAGPTLWEAESAFIEGRRWRITLDDQVDTALDLGPRTQHAMCVAAALLLSLACIDPRTVELARQSFDRPPGAQTCAPPTAEVQPVQDVNAPGCALVRRAFELGYASSLGDCAPRAVLAAAKKACTLRQIDEPIAHYAWRRIDEFAAGLGPLFRRDFFGERWTGFRARAHRIPSLGRAEREVLTSSPHAAIHLFTDLPDPRDGAFRADTCDERYRFLAHRPSATGDPGSKASKIFEHIVGQLLLEARYEPAAGACRELHVHFGAPADTCARIAEHPAEALAALGALSSVRAVIERHRVATDLVAIGGPPPAGEPASFLGFYCYLESGSPGRSSTPFVLDGATFSVEEAHVLPAGDTGLEVDRYDAIANLLVRGFHYGALLSEAGLLEGATLGHDNGLERMFSGDDYQMARLYGLEGFDIYLNPAWFIHRSDLWDVYPYQRHLKNYVQMFRRQYRREKGRL